MYNVYSFILHSYYVIYKIVVVLKLYKYLCRISKLKTNMINKIKMIQP